MNRRTLLAATDLPATAVDGTTFAHSDHGRKGQPGPNARAGMMTEDGGPGMMDGMAGMSGMMATMQRMHGDMMGDGMMGGGMGPMDGMMMMFDADGDGVVTPEELRAGLQAKLIEYDTDGDGSLSIAEFEPLHSAMIRKMMVRRFQHLNTDGDGSVTVEELTAPADKMERMQKMRASQERMQGQPGGGPGMGDGARMKDK